MQNHSSISSMATRNRALKSGEGVHAISLSHSIIPSVESMVNSCMIPVIGSSKISKLPMGTQQSI